VMGGKFPSCVLLLTLPPSMVDINVHPTKLEAKFADEKAVYHCVYWAAKNALYQKQEIPAVTLKTEEEPKMPTAKQITPAPKMTQTTVKRPTVVMQEPAILKKPEPAEPFVWKGLAQKTESGQAKISFGTEKPVIKVEEKPKETVKASVEPIVSKSEPVKEEVKQAEPVTMEQPVKEPEQVAVVPETKNMTYRICGQVFNTYILVEKDDELYLVDQHAAHERLRYEELLKQYDGRSVQSQMLLIPVTVRLTAMEESLFYEYGEMLSDLGFEAEGFGDKTVILRGAPEALDEQGLQTLFLEVLGNLGEKRKNASSEKAQRALYTIACKSAVKAGNKLQESEMKKLLDAVFALESINTCPHGRPITVAMTKTFIEKQFKRIV